MDAVQRDLDAARAANTRRAYAADWKHFSDWCRAHELVELPAEPATLVAYLKRHTTDPLKPEDRRKPATLERRLVVIGAKHRDAGYPSPTDDAGVRTAWRRMRQAVRIRQEGRAALLVDDLKLLVASLPETTAGTRDRALLLVGFAGAFRRSELVALDVADVAVTSRGLVVTIRRSKTDQLGQGQQVGIPRGRYPETCPVAALCDWLELASITSGPIFRRVDRHGHIGSTRLGDRAVAEVVQRAARACGLDPELYAGHSLRSGLATSAAVAGVEERVIMAQTRHTSVAVVRRYIRDGDLFRNNAAGRVGL